jgi:hypothetical protein
MVILKFCRNNFDFLNAACLSAVLAKRIRTGLGRFDLGSNFPNLRVSSMRTAPRRALTSVNCASLMLSSTPKRRAFGDFMVFSRASFWDSSAASLLKTSSSLALVASKAVAVPKGEQKFFFDQKLITGRDSGLYWLLRSGFLLVRIATRNYGSET